MFRLVSENSGFAHGHIIIINHGYLVNIDKLLYYILSLRLLVITQQVRLCGGKRCLALVSEEVSEKSSTSEEKILI